MSYYDDERYELVSYDEAEVNPSTAMIGGILGLLVLGGAAYWYTQQQEGAGEEEEEEEDFEEYDEEDWDDEDFGDGYGEDDEFSDFDDEIEADAAEEEEEDWDDEEAAPGASEFQPSKRSSSARGGARTKGPGTTGSAAQRSGARAGQPSPKTGKRVKKLPKVRIKSKGKGPYKPPKKLSKGKRKKFFQEPGKTLRRVIKAKKLWPKGKKYRMVRRSRRFDEKTGIRRIVVIMPDGLRLLFAVTYDGDKAQLLDKKKGPPPPPKRKKGKKKGTAKKGTAKKNYGFY